MSVRRQTVADVGRERDVVVCCEERENRRSMPLLPGSFEANTGCGFNTKFGVAEPCGVIVQYGSPHMKNAYIVTTKPLTGYYGLDNDMTYLRISDDNEDNEDDKKKYYEATKTAMNAISNTYYRNVYLYQPYLDNETFNFDSEVARMRLTPYSLDQTAKMTNAYGSVYARMRKTFGDMAFEMHGFQKM